MIQEQLYFTNNNSRPPQKLSGLLSSPRFHPPRDPPPPSASASRRTPSDAQRDRNSRFRRHPGWCPASATRSLTSRVWPLDDSRVQRRYGDLSWGDYVVRMMLSSSVSRRDAARSGELPRPPAAGMARSGELPKGASAGPGPAPAAAAVRHEGWLVRHGRRKIGRSFFHMRYFVLDNKLLAYYKKKPRDSMVCASSCGVCTHALNSAVGGR
jgi:hypothetical protein